MTPSPSAAADPAQPDDATLTIVAHQAGPTPWAWRDSAAGGVTSIQPPLPWPGRPSPRTSPTPPPSYRAVAHRFCLVVAEVLSARRPIGQVSEVFSDEAITVLKAHGLSWRGVPLGIATLRIQCPSVHALEVSARLGGGPEPVVVALRLTYDTTWRCTALLILATVAPLTSSCSASRQLPGARPAVPPDRRSSSPA